MDNANPIILKGINNAHTINNKKKTTKASGHDTEKRMQKRSTIITVFMFFYHF